MSGPDANDPIVSHMHTLWNNRSPRGMKWEFINGSSPMFGKLKRTAYA